MTERGSVDESSSNILSNESNNITKIEEEDSTTSNYIRFLFLMPTY